MICDLNTENIKNIIHNEKIDVLIVSYGGCCSNTLVTELQNNGYVCSTETWREILCHCPHYIEIDIPIIYIYDNPIKSFISMKNRGDCWWGLNQQKMSNNNNIVLSDENLIELMIKQFNSWTNIKRDNVLVIKSCELFENSIVDKLEKFLKKKLCHFPIPYITPKINIKHINKNNELFKKYKLEIDKINNFIIN